MIEVEDIKQLREKAGLSQQKLAILLNTSQKQISLFENGHIRPTRIKIISVLNAITSYMAYSDKIVGVDLQGNSQDDFENENEFGEDC